MLPSIVSNLRLKLIINGSLHFFQISQQEQDFLLLSRNTIMVRMSDTVCFKKALLSKTTDYSFNVVY